MYNGVFAVVTVVLVRHKKLKKQNGGCGAGVKWGGGNTVGGGDK